MDWCEQVGDWHSIKGNDCSETISNTIWCRPQTAFRLQTKVRNLDISAQHAYQITKKEIWKAEYVLLELNCMSDRGWGQDDPSVIICTTWHKPGVPSYNSLANGLRMGLSPWWKERYVTSQIIYLKTVCRTAGFISVLGPSWPHHHVLPTKIHLSLAYSTGTSQHPYLYVFANCSKIKQETTGKTKTIHTLQRRHKPWTVFISLHAWK